MKVTKVTKKTKPPYLATCKDWPKDELRPVLVFIPSIESGYPGPPFARGLIVRGIPGSKYHATGMTMIVNNFSCLQRVELIPSS